MNTVAEPNFLHPTPLNAATGSLRIRPKHTLNRNAIIAITVVVLHVVFLGALQSGLLARAAELVVPAEILTQLIELPAPQVKPLAPVVPKPQISPEPIKKTAAKPAIQPSPRPTPQPMPQLLAVVDPVPSPNAPSGVVVPQATLASATAVATVAASPGAAVATVPTAAPAVQLPSSDADYLQNPTPPYPPISRRLNEQGKTIVRVLIGLDGLPQRPEIIKYSGFDRLDQAALATVMRWRYVPGKRGGVPEAMWFNVPIHWVLE